jgi:hypothetical protein
MKKPWSEMYEKGYQNAIYFAYIPDFKDQNDIIEYSRGFHDGKEGEKLCTHHSTDLKLK